MTLRVDISIVPYGEEVNQYSIYRLDISNLGTVRRLGFGHDICRYSVKAFRHNNETERRLLNTVEWELEKEGVIDEHDRRDGAIELFRKATEIIGDI